MKLFKVGTDTYRIPDNMVAQFEADLKKYGYLEDTPQPQLTTPKTSALAEQVKTLDPYAQVPQMQPKPLVESNQPLGGLSYTADSYLKEQARLKGENDALKSPIVNAKIPLLTEPIANMWQTVHNDLGYFAKRIFQSSDDLQYSRAYRDAYENVVKQRTGQDMLDKFKAGDYKGGVIQSLHQSLAQMPFSWSFLLLKANPYAGGVALGLNTLGQAGNKLRQLDNRKDIQINDGIKFVNALATGGLEVATETIGDMLEWTATKGFVMAGGKAVLKKQIGQQIAKSLLSKYATMGLKNLAFENIEEQVNTILGRVLDVATGVEPDYQNLGKDMLDTAIQTSITTGWNNVFFGMLGGGNVVRFDKMKSQVKYIAKESTDKYNEYKSKGMTDEEIAVKDNASKVIYDKSAQLNAAIDTAKKGNLQEAYTQLKTLQTELSNINKTELANPKTKVMELYTDHLLDNMLNAQQENKTIPIVPTAQPTVQPTIPTEQPTPQQTEADIIKAEQEKNIAELEQQAKTQPATRQQHSIIKKTQRQYDVPDADYRAMIKDVSGGRTETSTELTQNEADILIDRLKEYKPTPDTTQPETAPQTQQMEAEQVKTEPVVEKAQTPKQVETAKTSIPVSRIGNGNLEQTERTQSGGHLIKQKDGTYHLDIDFLHGINPKGYNSNQISQLFSDEYDFVIGSNSDNWEILEPAIYEKRGNKFYLKKKGFVGETDTTKKQQETPNAKETGTRPQAGSEQKAPELVAGEEGRLRVRDNAENRVETQATKETEKRVETESTKNKDKTDIIKEQNAIVKYLNSSRKEKDKLHDDIKGSNSVFYTEARLKLKGYVDGIPGMGKTKEQSAYDEGIAQKDNLLLIVLADNLLQKNYSKHYTEVLTNFLRGVRDGHTQITPSPTQATKETPDTKHKPLLSALASNGKSIKSVAIEFVRILRRNGLLKSVKYGKDTADITLKDGQKVRINLVDGVIETDKAGKIDRTGDLLAVIDIARNWNAENKTMFHEAGHFIFDLLLDDTQKQTLLAEFKDEETVMDKWAEFMADKVKAKSTLTGKIRAIFEMLRTRWLDLVESVAGKKYATTAEGIFAEMARGKFKQGIKRTVSAEGKYAQVVNQQAEEVRKKYEGTKDWMKAPNGKPTNLNELQWCQVRTQAFKNWFGDWENDPKNASKVVDENGEPLVVYHGGKFNVNMGTPNLVGKYKKNWQLSFGMHFAVDKAEAENYVKHKNDSITAVFLNIRNPLYAVPNINKHGETVFHSISKSMFDTMPEKLKKEYIKQYGNALKETKTGYGYTEWLENSLEKLNQQDSIDAIHEMGFDGVAYEARGNLGLGRYRGFKSYIVLPSDQPNQNGGNLVSDQVKSQIKSATANIGTFDPANPDIRYKSLTDAEKYLDKQDGTPEQKAEVKKVVRKASKRLYEFSKIMKNNPTTPHFIKALRIRARTRMKTLYMQPFFKQLTPSQVQKYLGVDDINQASLEALIDFNRKYDPTHFEAMTDVGLLIIIKDKFEVLKKYAKENNITVSEMIASLIKANEIGMRDLHLKNDWFTNWGESPAGKLMDTLSSEGARAVSVGIKSEDKYNEITEPAMEILLKVMSIENEMESVEALRFVHLATISALEDRENADKVIKEYLSDKFTTQEALDRHIKYATDMYKLAKDFFDHFEKYIKEFNDKLSPGDKNRIGILPNYFSHLFRVKNLEQENLKIQQFLMGVINLGTDTSFVHTRENLTAKGTEEVFKQDIGAVMNSYLYGMARRLAFYDFAKTIYDINKNLNPALKKHFGTLKLMNWARNVMGEATDSPGRIFSIMRGNFYYQVLALGLRSTANNFLQRTLGKTYVSNKAYYKALKAVSTYKGELKGEMPLSIVTLYERLQREFVNNNIMVQLRNKLDMEKVKHESKRRFFSLVIRANEHSQWLAKMPFFMAERGNWGVGFMSGLYDYVYNHPEYNKMIDSGMSENEAVDKLLSNPEYYDQAYLSAMMKNAQVNPNMSKVFSPSLYRSGVGKMMMFTRYMVNQTENIIKTFFFNSKAEWNPIVRNALINGMYDDRKSADMVKVLNLFIENLSEKNIAKSIKKANESGVKLDAKEYKALKDVAILIKTMRDDLVSGLEKDKRFTNGSKSFRMRALRTMGQYELTIFFINMFFYALRAFTRQGAGLREKDREINMWEDVLYPALMNTNIMNAIGMLGNNTFSATNALAIKYRQWERLVDVGLNFTPIGFANNLLREYTDTSAGYLAKQAYKEITGN